MVDGAGTVSYQPMEVLHDGRVTRSSDVYSFGMIMLEMFTGVAVFDGYSSSQVRSHHRFSRRCAQCLQSVGRLGSGRRQSTVLCWNPAMQDIHVLHAADDTGRRSSAYKNEA